ncbi:hypothetical protein D8674_032138 [Pyrus ussuriensis x Pyrus communis]|uniref:Uncharacterized protein n=1 Tax=Pyrus ussuriensis x Pyrus communis TaxID=2448454 RepID=A0A5N5F0N0_9ROSA|nr:hypothetical protein D8674_032138 [Pyrus ussuriensis x Pyrus communis]
MVVRRNRSKRKPKFECLYGFLVKKPSSSATAVTTGAEDGVFQYPKGNGKEGWVGGWVESKMEGEGWIYDESKRRSPRGEEMRVWWVGAEERMEG